jgi:hypothetical protein
MPEESFIAPVSPTPTFVASFAPSDTEKTSAIERAWESILPPQDSFQLCKELEYSHPPENCARLRSRNGDQTLPDAPQIALESGDIVSYCLEDLDTPNMNKLGERLWRAAPNPDVKSLSRQLTFDRRIVITEDPSLHLVWTDNIIYIKPLPAYLTSYAFWQYLLDPSNDSIDSDQRQRLIATSIGYLQSYAYLIRHRSDFNLARRHELLASFPSITFETFIKFITPFSTLPSKLSSPRWHYGEISLEGLNAHSLIFLHRWHLNRFESSYRAYFQRFFPAVLFIYALFSVMLSAMQVIIAGRQLLEETDNKGLKKSVGIFEWFSIEAIGWSMGFGIVFLLWWVWITSTEAWKKMKIRKRVKRRLMEEGVENP